MIRVVRNPDETVAVDPTGRKPGRGSYIHPDMACVKAALSGGSLERALRMQIGSRPRRELLAALEHAAERAELLAHIARERGEDPGGPGASVKGGERC